jgi:hypothetical protein
LLVAREVLAVRSFSRAAGRPLLILLLFSLQSPLNDRELKPSVRSRLEQVLEREDAFCTIMEILKNRMSKEEPLKKRKH